MKGFATKGSRKGEKGFTLVELLIVFTLLGVLAAIIIPNVSGLIGYGHTTSGDAELSILQTAMDSMMAKEDLSAVQNTTVTSNMAIFPTGADADQFLYPNYLRYATTHGTFHCDADGQVYLDTTGYE